jgi:Fe-S oxidoreductase
MPRFAPQTFKQWFANREPRNLNGPRVILWPDTFNNHFFPRTARAAVEVLEAAGFRVDVPRASLCCGRPLYDFGMLDKAESLLGEILDALRPAIRAGVPVVGLEPSCVAVFRDELVNLFAHDEDARRLSHQTFLLSEFLEKQAADFHLPRLSRRAVVHGHCHHKAVMKMNDEARVLDRLGLDYNLLDSGCCGMAGSFGFEREHYDVSIAVGEYELLPHIRRAPKDALIIANGFSCREQIAQTTHRRALHLAEVLAAALRGGERALAGDYPEQNLDERARPSALPKALLIGTGALVASGILIWCFKHRR